MPVKTPRPTFRRVVALVALAAGVAGVLVLRAILHRAPGSEDVVYARTKVQPQEARSAIPTVEAVEPARPTKPVVGTPATGVALDEAPVRVDEPAPPKDPGSQRGAAEEPVKATVPIVLPPVGKTVGVPPASDPSVKAAAARGHEIIEKLKALSSGEDQWFIHESISDLVYLGEPVVPEIVGILESGFDKAYTLDPTTRSGRYYTHSRMILMDTLRQMRKPAATGALLQGVRKAGLLSDCNDLLTLVGWTDPELYAGVATLVPGALKQVQMIGLDEAERRHSALVLLLVRRIHEHSLKETQGTIEAILLAPPSGPNWLQHSYQVLFNQLVEFAPDRAVEVLRQLRARNPSDGFIADLTLGLKGTVPSARLVEYYEILLARVPLSARGHQRVLGSVPNFPYRESEDREFAKEAEDARVLQRFLEKRILMETNPDLKAALESKLGILKDTIAKLSK